MSHFRRTETACCFLCFMYWPTILIHGSSPHGFICTWNTRSISTDWLWIMIAQKKCRLICCVPRFLLWRWQFVTAVWHPKNPYPSIVIKWCKATLCVFNVNVRGGSRDSGSAELGSKAVLSFIVFLDLKTGMKESNRKNCRISQYLPQDCKWGTQILHAPPFKIYCFAIYITELETKPKNNKGMNSSEIHLC